jgi:5'-nucleotidase
MATILVDQDGILADCCGEWCDWLSEDYGIDVTTADITEWDTAKAPKLKHLNPKDVYKYLQRPGFFAWLKPLPGAIQGLQELHDAGHDLFIVTSPSGPESIVEKCAWIQKHLPFIDQKKIKFSHHKSMIKGDAIIDDRGSTLEQYAAAWPNALTLGIRYEYNSYLAGHDRIRLFDSYKDTAGAWKSIVQAVKAKFGDK